MQVKKIHRVKIFWKNVLEIVLAPVCVICETQRVSPNQYICSSCLSGLKPFSLPMLSVFQEELKKNEIQEPTFIGFQFNHTMKKAIHLLKYKGYDPIGFVLGTLLGNLLQEQKMSRFDVILPVPLHKKRKRERGYNQSEIIARGISTVLDIPVQESILQRIRYTSSQALLHREDRLKNMNGAFRLSPSAQSSIHGKHVLLVDDLITTGTTIREINKILVDKGVASILNCAVASSKT